MVSPGALAIHADPDMVVLQVLGKGQARERAALIGIHDLGFAVFADGLFECIQTKTGVHRDRDPMRQNAPRKPVHHDRQVDNPRAFDAHHPNRLSGNILMLKLFQEKLSLCAV